MKVENKKNVGVGISLPFVSGDFIYSFSDDFDLPLTIRDLINLNQSLRSVLYDFITEKISEE
jgi:hypothetical protein